MSLEQTTNDKAKLLTKLQRKMSLKKKREYKERRKLGKRLHAPLLRKGREDNNNEQANTLGGSTILRKLNFTNEIFSEEFVCEHVASFSDVGIVRCCTLLFCLCCSLFQ